MSKTITNQMPVALAIVAGLGTGYGVWRRGWSWTASCYTGVATGFIVKVMVDSLLQHRGSTRGGGATHGQGQGGKQSSFVIPEERYKFSEVNTSEPLGAPIDWQAALEAAVEAERPTLEVAKITWSWRSSGVDETPNYEAEALNKGLMDSLEDSNHVLQFVREGTGRKKMSWPKGQFALSAGTQQEVNDCARRRLFYDGRWLATDTTLQLIESLLEGTDVLNKNGWTLRVGKGNQQAEIVDTQGRVVQIDRVNSRYSINFTGPLEAKNSANAARKYFIIGDQFRQTENVSIELEKLLVHIFAAAA
jgi:hypothetical protein